MGGSIIRRILSVSLSPVSAVRARTVQTEVAPLRPGACAVRLAAGAPARAGPARALHTGARRSDVRRKDGSQLRPCSPEHRNVWPCRIVEFATSRVLPYDTWHSNQHGPVRFTRHLQICITRELI